MFTFKIDTNEKFGRHTVLIQNVSAGEIVVDELPFVYGPKQNSPIVCLECYRPVNIKNNTSRCSCCGWPLCKHCQNNIVIHKGECDIFTSAKVIFNAQLYSSSLLECPQLDCITPLRVLLKKEADPKRWNEEVAPMEYHDAARKATSEIWNADLINVARYLRGPCKLTQFSEELIMQVIGILEVNAFEARTSLGYPFRGLYPITGIIAHTCVPNTMRSIYPSQGYRMRLRAMVDLKQGEQLAHSYTYILSGTATRLEHLKNGKYFTCKCQRCTDPTELGTHFSSFRCEQCDSGMVLTTDPFDMNANWKCSECNSEILAENIENIQSAIQSEIDDAQAMEMNPNRLALTEQLYKKFTAILSPYHFMLTSLRMNLIELYGRVKGFEMINLSDKLLEHKEQLCRQVLYILDKFEPGMSRSRAMMLYELHVPLVLLSKSQYITGCLTPENLKIRLQEATSILHECYNILQNEDPLSHEGNLSIVVYKALQELQNSIDSINCN